MPVPQSIQLLQFPVLLWRKGYSYVANDPLELCVHPRSLYQDTRRRAQASEFMLADSSGKIFQVTDFEPVRPFGGIKRFGHVLLRSVFAVPILQAADILTLPEFGATLSKALRARFGKAFAAQLAEVEGAAQLVSVIAERDRISG